MSPVTVICKCGAVLHIPDSDQPGTVRCTHCDRLVAYPGDSVIDDKSVVFEIPRDVAATVSPSRVPPDSHHHVSRSGFISVTCKCGKVVKVPSSMSGKIGRCPLCAADLVVPWVSSSTGGSSQGSSPVSSVPVSSAATVSAPAAVAKPGPIEPVNPNNSDWANDSLGGASLSSDMIISSAEMENDQWDKHHQAKVYDQIRHHQGISSQVNIAKRKNLIAHLFSLPSRVTPLQASALGVMMLAMALVYLIHILPSDYSDVQRHMPAPTRYYYDLSQNRTLELTDGEFASLNSAGSAPASGPVGSVVRAYVYACGSCESDPHQIALLERFTPEALKADQELTQLVSQGKAGTDQSTAFSKIIQSGHFIGRFVPPPDAGTAPSTQSSPDSLFAGAIERMKWTSYELARDDELVHPLPHCAAHAIECLPAPKAP